MAGRSRSLLLLSLLLSIAVAARAQDNFEVPTSAESAVPIAAPGASLALPTAAPKTAAATASFSRSQGPALVLPSPAPASDSGLQSEAAASLSTLEGAPAPSSALTSAAPAPRSNAPQAVLQSLAAPAPSLSSVGEEAKGASDADWSRRLGLNVWVAASEAVPFIKSGGLADVTDGLSRELAAQGHRVTLVLPKYKGLNLKDVPAPERVGTLSVPFSDGAREAALWKTRSGGMDILLVENDAYFSRDGLYGTSYGDHPDNDERFLFFSKAFFEAARALGTPPDVIHAHDWPTGLVPALLALHYAADPFFARAASVFTVHNMAYQGLFSKEVALKAFDAAHLTPDKLEYYGKVSYLKAGIALANKVTTVSRSYARETAGSNAFGRGMEGVLAHRGADYSGIVNGLDPAAWDPATDPKLPVRYDLSSWKQGKAANKADLQAAARLPVRAEAPLFGVAARLDPQKGLDLVAAAAPLLRREGAQLAIVGNGSKELTELFQELQQEYPETVAARTVFDEAFARRIYAAADFYLMPSRFEPCGLSQLIAMRYGALPLVTPTGGLLDTVADYDANPATATGLILKDDSISSLEAAILKAISLWRAPPERKRLVRNLMTRDSSWKGPAAEYAELYREALKRKG